MSSLTSLPKFCFQMPGKISADETNKDFNKTRMVQKTFTSILGQELNLINQKLFLQKPIIIKSTILRADK